jgi:hypothetical protein
MPFAPCPYVLYSKDMTETADFTPSPRDAALGMLDPKTVTIISRLDNERGPSLLNVMAARYAERNGADTVQDYLESVAKREGVVMPVDEVHAKALEHFDQLVGQSLPSQLRENLGNGDPSLPAGSLMHCLRYDETVLATITLSGVVAREFSPDIDGAIVNDDMYGDAFFFEAPRATTVGDLNRELSSAPMAKKVLPGTENGGDSVAIIFDPTIDDLNYAALIAAQSADYAAKPKAQANSAIALPVGLPAGGIAGLVLGENITADSARLDQLKTLFPAAPLLRPDGALVY